MGDHRSASADSRSHLGDVYGGTIGVDDVIGKAAVIVWPVSRFGLVDSPDIQGTEAAAAGQTILDYANGSRGHQDYEALTDELLRVIKKRGRKPQQAGVRGELGDEADTASAAIN